MPGVGEYRPDASEGITRVADLPRAKIVQQSRNFKRRLCPCCGQRLSGSRDPSNVARRGGSHLGTTAGDPSVLLPPFLYEVSPVV